MDTVESLESLRSYAAGLEPKLARLEDAVLGQVSIQHGPQFLREQLKAAAAFRNAGATRQEEICYLTAYLTFDLLETHIATRH